MTTEFKGNIPEAFKQKLAERGVDLDKVESKGPKKPVKFTNTEAVSMSQLDELTARLEDYTNVYEQVELPSKGKFYNGSDGPTSGIVNMRTMTGQEEQCLANQSLVKKGDVMDRIFFQCMREKFDTNNFLSIDKMYMLIWLRGKSFGAGYEVEIACPDCGAKYNHVIDLNSLEVEDCPDTFTIESLSAELPTSKFKFTYRIPRGRDDKEIQSYKERRLKSFGTSAEDNTLSYRTALLIDNIEGMTDKTQIQKLITRLPITDAGFIRNCINEPPFGVNTDIEMICPNCAHEFVMSLPFDANFFFPRQKKDKTQAS